MSNPQQMPLESLLMTAKPLADLHVAQGKWVSIAGELKKAFPKETNGVTNLCTIYYAHQKRRLIGSGLHQHKVLVVMTVDFLEAFMRANGQWDYIEKQDWYTKREFAIGIDVNYYPDRSEFKLSPDFHKDTGGNNIFVNLIFDNKQPIEATEWFVDVADPSGNRAEWQRKLLPPDHLLELNALREALRAKQKGQTPVVNGGVLRGENIYVSWVDDLVWHATPCVNQRIEYTAEAAADAYETLDQSQSFSYRDPKFNDAEILGVELIGTMAEHPETDLAEWLRAKDKQVQDLDYYLASAAWYALYRGDNGKQKFVADAEKRATAPWRITGKLSEAIAKDHRLMGGHSMTETPVGLSRARRANSVDSKELKEVAAANKNVPRSFIRTWVRILRADSTELAKAKFTLT